MNLHQQKLVQQMIDNLRNIANLDFALQPGFKFIANLRGKLIDKGFSPDNAEIIVSNMEVIIPEGYCTDEQLEELAVIYCQIMAQARKSLLGLNFQNPTAAIARMASQMYLKFE